MKEFEFLKLQEDEFVSMLKSITKERLFLRVKSIQDQKISLLCTIGIPTLLLEYKFTQKEECLKVTRKLNWLPLLFSLLPILLFFELITFGISMLVGEKGYWSYVIIAVVFVILTFVMVFFSLNESDAVMDSLYKVEI
ncbi:MAG: hypothetical protein ACTSYD_06220 [Candidatus Heimdallarchaeaceae archaeon]